MSKIKQIRTQLRDFDAVARALGELGIPFQDCRANPIQLVDYYGTKTAQRAEVVIKKNDVLKLPNITPSERSAHYCDVGLYRNEDGTYGLLLDDIHGRSAATVLGEKLTQYYGGAAAVIQLESRGYTVESWDVDAAGELDITLADA